jgi:RES domain-containing protein
VALYASRAQGAHFAEKPQGLAHRIQEIQEGQYNEEWNRVLAMSQKELTDLCATLK